MCATHQLNWTLASGGQWMVQAEGSTNVSKKDRQNGGGEMDTVVSMFWILVGEIDYPFLCRWIQGNLSLMVVSVDIKCDTSASTPFLSHQLAVYMKFPIMHHQQKR